MKNKRTVSIFFLGCCAQSKDEKRDPGCWGLSEEGEERTRELKNGLAERSIKFDLKLINSSKASMQTARLVEDNPELRALTKLNKDDTFKGMFDELRDEPVGRYADLAKPPFDRFMADAFKTWITNVKQEVINTIEATDAQTVLIVTEPMLAYALAFQFRSDEEIRCAIPKAGTYVEVKTTV